MELHYKELSNTIDKDFSNAIQIYIESFPSNERQPIPIIKKRVEEGKSKLFIGSIKNEIVCIAFLWYFLNSKYVLLDYMAVSEKHRNKKIGGVFFKFLTEKVFVEKKYLLIEVEDNLYGFNKEQRKRRINFYLKNGAFILNNIKYRLPSLDNTLPTEMLLMIVPYANDNQINKNEVENIIKRLYLELYEKTDNDKMLNSIINNLPNNIILINNNI